MFAEGITLEDTIDARTFGIITLLLAEIYWLVKLKPLTKELVEANEQVDNETLLEKDDGIKLTIKFEFGKICCSLTESTTL